MKGVLMLSGLMCSLFISLTLTRGDTFYVSRTGNNSTGTSWTAAWNNLDQIKWSAVRAGDVICIDGGTSGMNYSGLTTGTGGTGASRITIERSGEAGHDGTVTMGHISASHPYVTVNGKDRTRFTLTIGTGYGVRVTPEADGFELKGVCVQGDFSGSWGSLLYADARTVTISGCEFYRTNAEDQMKYRYRGPDGRLLIEDCYFHGLRSIDGRHADALEAWTLDNKADMVIRRNLFTDNPTDCFMMSDDDFGTLEYYYNVFDGVADAIKIKSAENLKVYNNVFNNCRDIIGGAAVLTKRNNIYCGRGPWSSGTVQVSGGDTKYCLNDIITINFIAGEGNLRANPLFADPDNAVGPDQLPFTDDDGFRLQAGSPAINAGTDVGLSTDIMGNAVSGTVDIGAYEYVTTNVERRMPNVEYQISHPISCPHYDILGDMVPDAYASGIYLVVPEEHKGLKKIFIFK